MIRERLTSKLLAILQLTRAALIFTAIADSSTLVLLHLPGEAPQPHPWLLLILTGLASACLYAFGMSLNDLLDVRRDRIFARWRPLPSGRLSNRSAVVIALLLLMLGLFFGAMVGVVRGEANVPWSLLLCFMAAVVIVFYNATAKYLGAVGLLCLGVARALNCMIGFPRTQGLLLPLILFTHITLISAIAYHLEHKRPRLKVRDLLLVIFGVLGADAFIVDVGIWRGQFPPAHLTLLLGPLLVTIAYWGLVIVTLRNSQLPARARGGRIMLVGLFWLFVYDASLLAANAQWVAAGGIACLGILAWISFLLMRGWSRRVTLERPHYRFARRPT